MTEQDIYAQLEPVFRKTFPKHAAVLGPGTTAKDVKGWDSLGNIRLIIETERAFKVRFATSEIANQKNLGDFVALVRSKL